MSDRINSEFENWCALNCIIPSPSRLEAYQAALRSPMVMELVEGLRFYIKHDSYGHDMPYKALKAWEEANE